MEDEKIGPVADQVKEKAKETGQEALERGKHVAEQAAETRARTRGREQAEQLKDSAQAKAQEALNGRHVRSATERRNAAEPSDTRTDEKRSGRRRRARPTRARAASCQTVKRTITEFREDNLTDWAAALTYYAVLVDLPGADRAGLDRRPGRRPADDHQARSPISSARSARPRRPRRSRGRSRTSPSSGRGRASC